MCYFVYTYHGSFYTLVAFYLTEDPVLTLAVEASSNETRLICAFIFNISDVDFSVEWYLNDKVIKEDTLINKTDGLLLEKDITLLKQGDQVQSCLFTQMQAWGTCLSFPFRYIKSSSINKKEKLYLR